MKMLNRVREPRTSAQKVSVIRKVVFLNCLMRTDRRLWANVMAKDSEKVNLEAFLWNLTCHNFEEISLILCQSILPLAHAFSVPSILSEASELDFHGLSPSSGSAPFLAPLRWPSRDHYDSSGPHRHQFVCLCPDQLILPRNASVAEWFSSENFAENLWPQWHHQGRDDSESCLRNRGIPHTKESPNQ
jgi:hypothetical protein